MIAKQTEKATVQLDVEPTAHLDLATLPAQIREALTEQPNGDRSAQEYHFVARCIETGMADGDILAAFQHYPPAAARGDVERHAELTLTNAKAKGVRPLVTRFANEMAPTDAVHGLARWSDLGNAYRLVRRHGEDLHHVPELGAWCTWDGTRWLEDITGDVMRKAKTVVKSIIDEAKTAKDDTEQKAATKHWLVSQNANRLHAMIDLAATEPGIPVTIDQLDADPFLLNVANGTLDLRTGARRRHRRDDLITKLTPIRYYDTARRLPNIDDSSSPTSSMATTS